MKKIELNMMLKDKRMISQIQKLMAPIIPRMMDKASQVVSLRRRKTPRS